LLDKSGVDAETLLKCSLMDFYANCMSIESTEKLFEEAPSKCTVIWNKDVTLNAEKESWRKALDLFHEMRSRVQVWRQMKSPLWKFSMLVERVEALMLGKEIHGQVIR